jgi:hypothetical protein
LGPWQPFKQNIYQKHKCTRLFLPSTTKYEFLKGPIQKTLCIDTTCTIIGEFESEFKKALGHESGAQGRFFDEKTEGIKFRGTVPLNTRKRIQSAGSYQTIVQNFAKLNSHNMKQTILRYSTLKCLQPSMLIYIFES